MTVAMKDPGEEARVTEEAEEALTGALKTGMSLASNVATPGISPEIAPSFQVIVPVVPQQNLSATVAARKVTWQEIARIAINERM